MNDEISDHAASYDFVKMGQGLADTLMRAAEEQMTKAQTMMDQTKSLVEIIRNQVMAQAKSSEDMNARFKQVGSIMLDAHRILNGDIASGLGPLSQHGHAVEPASSRDIVKLRALSDAYGGRGNPAGLGTLPADLVTDPKRKHRAEGADGYRELPNAVEARGEPYAPWAGGNSENRRDPGVSSKQPDRD